MRILVTGCAGFIGFSLSSKLLKNFPKSKIFGIVGHNGGYTKKNADCCIRIPLADKKIIKPGKVMLVPTGIAVAIDKNYEIQIRPRSGLAAKKGISVLNTPGTIDSDYRGEIKIILINLSK